MMLDQHIYSNSKRDAFFLTKMWDIVNTPKKIMQKFQGIKTLFVNCELKG